MVSLLSEPSLQAQFGMFELDYLQKPGHLKEAARAWVPYGRRVSTVQDARSEDLRGGGAEGKVVRLTKQPTAGCLEMLGTQLAFWIKHTKPCHIGRNLVYI